MRDNSGAIFRLEQERHELKLNRMTRRRINMTNALREDGLKCFVGILLCACLCFAGAAGAQSPGAAPKTPAASHASPDLTAQQILDKYVQAIGGREAWEKLKTRVSMGTIEIPSMSLSGTVLVHEKAPNRMLMVVILAGSAFRQGFDGTEGWSDDPVNGVRVKSGAALEEMRRDADFYHPLHLQQIYTKFAVKGTETINGRDAYVLEATLPDGGADKMYFDKESGLVIRMETQQHTSDGVQTFVEDIEDYHQVDGVKLPFTVHQTNSASSYTIRFGDVHHNTELDDSEFAQPAAQ